MTIKDKLHLMSNDEIEKVADKICELVQEAVDKAQGSTDPCDVCPFTTYCSIGHTGFVEFIKQDVKEICIENGYSGQITIFDEGERVEDEP